MSKFGNIVQAKAEMSMTKDQLEAKKQEVLAKKMDELDPSHWGNDTDTIRKKLKELHKYMVKAVTTTYDCQQRKIAQEYDLKELNERQRQVARNEAAKKGADPADPSGRPAKKPVMARGERQIDRRNFKERRQVFDKKNSIPHYPNTPPPEQPLEKIVALHSVGFVPEEEEEEEGEE